MKSILIIGMPDSIHVARWIKQINDQDWIIHLFPSVRGTKIHPEIDYVVYHFPYVPWKIKYDKNIPLYELLHFFCKIAGFLWWKCLDILIPNFRKQQLIKVIHKVKPSLIHTLEIQAAGYLTMEVKKNFRGGFPPWLVTNWGSDIYLFGRIKEHKEKIVDVLNNSDYYSCECERDITLAKQFKFKGMVMPVFPNTGGFDLMELDEERNLIKTSKRKLIMLKGYQHWAGRALVGLRALNRCNEILKGYSIAIYSATPDVVISAELFSIETGIPIQIIRKDTPHREILSLHAKARISIGLSICDAISTSFLEAMVMGSFPIQSCTSCAEEWIIHGVSGMIVPPEDPDIIEIFLRTAITDDELVDKAASINWTTAQRRLDSQYLKNKAIEMYSTILNN